MCGKEIIMTFFPNSGNIPKLRFSEFAGEWEERYISEVISSKSKKNIILKIVIPITLVLN